MVELTELVLSEPFLGNKPCCLSICDVAYLMTENSGSSSGCKFPERLVTTWGRVAEAERSEIPAKRRVPAWGSCDPIERNFNRFF